MSCSSVYFVFNLNMCFSDEFICKFFVQAISTHVMKFMIILFRWKKKANTEDQKGGHTGQIGRKKLQGNINEK